MFKFKILSLLLGTLDGLLDQDSVFRMRPFESLFNRGSNRSIVLEYPKCFLRPVELGRGKMPAETARFA